MKNEQGIKYYSPQEERLNISTHIFGLVLSLVALVLLVMRANQHGDLLYLVSFSVFGASLVVLYSASVTYHSMQQPDLRKKSRMVDHMAIFLLIAGSYTPLTLITLGGKTGWTIFTILWSIAICGLGLKIFFTGKYKLLSTLLYLLMGWMVIFAIKPLFNNMSVAGLSWFIAGGLAYTLGAMLYNLEKIKFNHAIFHMFVLAGSFCHFIAVYNYV